jgi:23S rRNA pseudouridine2605 synthase
MNPASNLIVELYEENPMSQMRLQRYLALCGLGSRRSCETYIVKGKVTVDGVIVTELGTKIDTEHNVITFMGNIIQPEEKQWMLLNKPPGYLCTMKDTRNRPMVSNLLPTEKGRLYPVGRLDFMSQGLLLITNDGELAQRLAHPRYEILKTYKVTTLKALTLDQMRQMKLGVHCDKEILRVQSITLLQSHDTKYLYSISLKEGRYRHIRRMFKEFHIPIVSLERTAIGPLTLGNLQMGAWRYLTKQEIDLLQVQTTRDKP